MSTILDKLAAARSSAVAASGIPGAVAAVAAKQTAAPNPTIAPHTASKKSVSALREEDMIPRKTKESQVLFKTQKPSLNCVIASVGREPKRMHFVNQHLLTEDTEVIAYMRKNAVAFALSEVGAATKSTEATYSTKPS